ncbi:hypothetical protein Efla_005499 [Eimeria flavescens]
MGVGARRDDSSQGAPFPRGPSGPGGAPPPFELDLDAPVRGISVNLRGLEHVSPETIAPELQGFQGVKTVRDLLLAVEATQVRLSSLNLFSVLTSELHCGEKDGDVSVTLHLKEEARRYSFGLNINGSGQTEIEAAAVVPAVGGSNKSLHLSAAAAPTDGASRVVAATLAAPRLPVLLQRGLPLFSCGSLRLFSSNRDFTSYNSTSLSSSGVTAEVKAADGSHSLGVGLTLRDSSPLSGATRVASPSVLRLPWRSLKHSLRYAYTRNRLDGRNEEPAAAAAAAADRQPVLLPRQGYVLQTVAEAALPGGDARFIKGELHAFAATPIRPPFTSTSSSSSSSSSSKESPWVLTGRLGMGALLGLPWGAPLSLDDRFSFNRMVSPLRGFRAYGVGPTDQAYLLHKDRGVCTPVWDYLGGDAYFASEVCLAYDFHLPQKASSAASSGSSSSSSGSSCGTEGRRGFGGHHPRWFLFGSLGSLGDVFTPQRHWQQREEQQQTVGQRLSSLLKAVRGSVGVGLAFPLSQGVWLEACFALPLRRATTDEAERFQVGFKVASVDAAGA